MAIALHLPSLNLDPKRIVANALVLSLHIVALALLMAPIRWQPSPIKTVEPIVPDAIVPVVLPVTPPQPPPPTRASVQPPRARPTPVANPMPQLEPDAPVLADSAPIDVVVEASGESTTDSFDAMPAEAGSGLSTLSYAEAPPPRYPAPALRAGQEGEVVLRVLVNSEGRVQHVLIEQSSGHRQLDLAAARQVRTRWRFHPALRNGEPISAWGLVPIVFSLPR